MMIGHDGSWKRKQLAWQRQQLVCILCNGRQAWKVGFNRTMITWKVKETAENNEKKSLVWQHNIQQIRFLIRKSLNIIVIMRYIGMSQRLQIIFIRGYYLHILLIVKKLWLRDYLGGGVSGAFSPANIVCPQENC